MKTYFKICSSSFSLKKQKKKKYCALGKFENVLGILSTIQAQSVAYSLSLCTVKPRENKISKFGMSVGTWIRAQCRRKALEDENKRIEM